MEGHRCVSRQQAHALWSSCVSQRRGGWGRCAACGASSVRVCAQKVKGSLEYAAYKPER